MDVIYYSYYDSPVGSLLLAGDGNALTLISFPTGKAARQPEADWISVLGLLDDDTPLAERPVLPVALDAHPEALLLRRMGDEEDRIDVLRLWPAPARLEDGTPLWVGRFETMRVRRRLRLLMLWKPLPMPPGLPVEVRTELSTFPHQDVNGRMHLRTDTP